MTKIAYGSKDGYEPEGLLAFKLESEAKIAFGDLEALLKGSDSIAFQERAEDGSFIVGFHGYEQEDSVVYFIASGELSELQKKVESLLTEGDFSADEVVLYEADNEFEFVDLAQAPGILM